jgi:hypothetical protein
MLAIQIKYKDSSEIIGVEHGLIMMNITSNENDAFLYAGTTDSDRKTRNVWYKYDQLSQDDEICIEIVETDTITEPKESVYNASIRPQLSKVEQFRLLETALKEEGLI